MPKLKWQRFDLNGHTCYEGLRKSCDRPPSVVSVQVRPTALLIPISNDHPNPQRLTHNRETRKFARSLRPGSKWYVAGVSYRVGNEFRAIPEPVERRVFSNLADAKDWTLDYLKRFELEASRSS